MRNVTAIIISFLRPGYTKACIKSLRTLYPDINILVGENGEFSEDMQDYCDNHDAEYIQLPYDSGVCVGRNELVKQVDTEYVLVGDDDFFYTDGAQIEKMVKFLKYCDTFDLIGGRVIQDGVLRNYQGHIDRSEKSIKLTPLAVDDSNIYMTDVLRDIRYCPADLTFNFFVARTEKVKAVPWDEEIKVAYEHLSWFIDFKEAGYKVAFTPDAVVVHKPANVDPQEDLEYKAFRSRRSDKDRFFEKFGVDYTITMNGMKDFKPGHIVHSKRNDTKFVDFCITTFKRPKAVEKLVLSIAEHYPMANIYIADQNEKFDREFYKGLRSRAYDAGLIKRISAESLPYDCGISYARNHLVATTPNKYKLILDDDFAFTEKTDIGKMVSLMEAHPKAGVVGGCVEQLGHKINFEFIPKKIGDTIEHTSDGDNYRMHDGMRYKRTGCVLNFALMRKDMFAYIRWDQDLKVSEHLDFYIRMKDVPFYVLYIPEVIVDHPPAERDADYKQMRQRDEFQIFMLKKHGAKRVKYQNGQVVELTGDGSLKRYKEL